jgi:hypothetical protein
MTMTTWAVRGIPVVAALLLAGPAAGQRFTLSGERVALHNLAGEVRVEAGSGSAVVVEVTRGGSGAGSVRAERASVDGYDAVRVVFPDSRIVYPRMGRGSNSTFQVRTDGTFGGGWRSGDSRRVTVSGSGSGTEAWADARVLVPRGRTVRIYQGVGRVTVANVDGQIQVRTAAAPVSTSATSGSLDVEVGSGSVQVDDARGGVRVESGSGSVRLANVRGPEVRVETGSGGVSGTAITAERVQVEVGSGGVQLSGVGAGDVDVESGSGSVRLGLTRNASRVRVETGSGGVTLGVPESFGAELAVDTGSGGIRVDLPVTERSSRRGQLRGRLGDGRGSVRIDTGSGGVSIVRS